MAKKEPFIPGLPDRFEPEKADPEYKSRKDWNRAIQEQLQFFRKFDKKADTKNLVTRFDYDGPFSKRRADALLDSVESIYARYGHLESPDEHPNTLGKEWLHLNLAFGSYSSVEARSYVLLAAAIWMLDRIGPDHDKRRVMFQHLPTDEDIWEYVHAPDVWDTLHDEDVIDSLLYVLQYRNSDDGELELDGSGMERVLTDSLTAANAHHRDTSCRKNFDTILALIPQEEIDRAVEHFRGCFWAWTDRYFACVKPLIAEIRAQDDKIRTLGEQFNEVRDTLRLRMIEHDRKMAQQRASTRKKSAPNPLLMKSPASLPSLDISTLSGSFGHRDYSRASPDMIMATDPEMREMMTLADKMDRLGTQYNEEVDKIRAMMEKEHRFLIQFIHEGCISKEECERQYGAEVADVMNPIAVADPFELCFALLYLIDSGDDMPWLYGAGVGMMNEVAEALPWGVLEYDEEEDRVVFGDAVAGKPSAMPDWYERRYVPKKRDVFDFPRSLAQIIYEETGCIMPRDMHRFDSELKSLGRYGIRGKDALMMLTCMTVLSHARRRTAALNFDHDFLRFLAEEDGAERTGSSEDEDDEQTAELRDEIRRLKAALHDSERNARDIRKELDAVRQKESMERRELADLREVVFNSEASDESEVEPEQDVFPYAVTRNTVIFGGHSTWEKAIKPMLTGSVRFISRDLMFDTSIVRNAEVIWIQTNAISHTQYYRVVDTARQYNKPVRYFAYASAAKCAMQLVENDMS